MYQAVVNKLIEKDYHISFAESCTGGMACAALVSVADASKVLDVSFVTYANEAKIRYLGVDNATIVQYGVVSEEVARQMAQELPKKPVHKLVWELLVWQDQVVEQRISRWEWFVLGFISTERL